MTPPTKSMATSQMTPKNGFLKMRRASDYHTLVAGYCTLGLFLGLLQILLTA